MDITCEVCGYDGSFSWLIKCKNSHICGQGRHLYCLDGLDVPSSTPKSLRKYGELECSLCAQTRCRGKSAGKAATAAASTRAADEPSRIQKRQKVLPAATDNTIDMEEETFTSDPNGPVNKSLAGVTAGGPASSGVQHAPGGDKPQLQLPQEYSVFEQLDTQQQFCFDDDGGGDVPAAAVPVLSGQKLLSSGKSIGNQHSAAAPTDKAFVSSENSQQPAAGAGHGKTAAISVAHAGSADDSDDVPLRHAQKGDVKAPKGQRAAPLQPKQPQGVLRTKQYVAASSGKMTGTGITQQVQGQLKGPSRPAKLIEVEPKDEASPFLYKRRSAQQEMFATGFEGPTSIGNSGHCTDTGQQQSGPTIMQPPAGTGIASGVQSWPPRSIAAPAGSVPSAAMCRPLGTAVSSRIAGDVTGAGVAVLHVLRRVTPAVRSGGSSYPFNIKQVLPVAGSSTKHLTNPKGHGSTQDTLITGVGSAPSVRSQSSYEVPKDLRSELWSGILPCHELQVVKGSKGVRVIMSATNPHNAMVKLCQELLQQPADDMKWSLANQSDVPHTILTAKKFYADNMACETCLVLYNRYQFGGAKEQFQQLLSTLRESGGFLVLDVRSTLKERLQRIPLLESLLASPVKGSRYTCDCLFFSPYQVPVDYLDLEKGYLDCLICLSGSRYHIHMVASWDKAHRNFKGILRKVSQKQVSHRVQFFNVGDDSDGANKQPIRRQEELKEGHKRKESQMELGKDIRAVLAAKQDQQDDEKEESGNQSDVNAGKLAAEEHHMHSSSHEPSAEAAIKITQQTSDGKQAAAKTSTSLNQHAAAGEEANQQDNTETTPTTTSTILPAGQQSRSMTAHDCHHVTDLALQHTRPQLVCVESESTCVHSVVPNNSTSAAVQHQELSSTLRVKVQAAQLHGNHLDGQFSGDSDNSANTSFGQVCIIPERGLGDMIQVPDFSWFVGRRTTANALQQVPYLNPITQQHADTGLLRLGTSLGSNSKLVGHLETSGVTSSKSFSQQEHVGGLHLAAEQLLEDVYISACHQDDDKTWRAIPASSEAINCTLTSCGQCLPDAGQGAYHWGHIKLPLLQLTSNAVGDMYSRLGLALLTQLPHLWTNLQVIPKLPLNELCIQLLATDDEAGPLSKIFKEAQEVLGFSFFMGSLTKAPQDVSHIHVLALSKRVVEKASDLKGLIIKSVAVHPIQMYRASTLALALQALARKVRQQQQRVVTLADAIQLAQQCGAASEAECKPLYPARVVVLMDAQGFLETPTHNLKELADCLQQGSRAWGECWSLLMRASDIMKVQHQGSAELKAFLVELLTVEVQDNDNSGASSIQFQILQVLDSAVESRQTDVVLLCDALKLMHERKPARLVLAVYSDKSKDTTSGAKLVAEHHRCKDILAGSVTETLHFLRQLLRMQH